MGMSINIVEEFREYVEFLELWLPPSAFVRFMEGDRVVVTTRGYSHVFLKFEKEEFIDVHLRGTVLMMAHITQLGVHVLRDSEPENEEAIMGKIVWV